MGVKTFDMAKCYAIFGGRRITGFADDGLSLAFNEDEWTLSPGIDPDTGVRVKQNRFDGRVTLNLLHTSESNAYLQGVKATDDLTGQNYKSFQLRDLYGRDLFTAREMWVIKVPDIGLGRTLQPRVWMLESLYIQVTPRGLNL